MRMHASIRAVTQTLRTCNHVHPQVLVVLCEQIDGVLEGGGAEKDGGDIPKQDALFGVVCAQERADM